MERYTPGDSPNVTSFMARRTLATHGSFFRPFLWPGAHVLDCGCGPGSITSGIAASVFPDGLVFAIDANDSQIASAMQALRAFPNAQCRVASIYDLPFEANRFDGVFSHALFEHLADPRAAALQILRVLKPGGVVGIRSPDWTGRLVGPPDEQVDEALRHYSDIQAANGGDLGIGRKLASILRESGFTRIRATASYECYSPASVIGEYLALQIENSETTVQSAQSATEIAAVLRAWYRSPDAFFAQAWCEVIAEKSVA